jgi:DNA-binding transcriptional LysR family regulator
MSWICWNTITGRMTRPTWPANSRVAIGTPLAGSRASSVRPRHPFGDHDGRWRGDDRVRPEYSGREPAGGTLFRRLPAARPAALWRVGGFCGVPPAGSIEIALAALENCGRAWRIVCTSSSLSGLRAAALAGLGVTIVAAGLIPLGLVEIGDGLGQPDLGTVEFVLHGSGRMMHGPAAKLADAILASGIRLQRPEGGSSL